MTTGLRRRELGHLKVDDIKFIDFETVHIFSVGKGGKHNRTVLKGIVAVAKLKEYISRAEKMNNDFLLTKAEAHVPDGLHYCRAMCAQITYNAVLQEMENDPAKRAKYRMSLNAARESSRRISTKFIASEAITEKQHYQSASQLSTIEWQRCMLACSYSTTSARIQLFYIIW